MATPAWLLQDSDPSLSIWTYAAGALFILVVAILGFIWRQTQAEMNSRQRLDSGRYRAPPAAPPSPRASPSAAPSAAPALRDPICGRAVSPESAAVFRAGGEVVYFCSPDCRSRYVGLSRTKS